MKIKTYLLSFVLIALVIIVTELAAVSVAHGQAPFRIQGKCKPPNASTYGSITVESLGDIRVRPCPSRSTIFSGVTDFSGAIVSNPFRIGDPSYDNYYGTPLVNLLTAGWGTLSTRKVIPSGGVFTLAEFGANLTLPAVTTYTTGLLTALDVQGGGNNMSVRGHYINLFSNSTTPTGASDLIGSDINVDIGGAFNSAYGVRINTLSGGSGASGLVNIYGMQATVNMAHNGNTTNAFGGDFYLSSSNSSPSVVTTGNILRARALIRDGVTVTSLTGLKVGDWALQGAGTTANTIGLHLDNTIDLGTGTRYAIKSDSISDSLFAGAVRAPINPYDATTWNGSNKLATEDAIRDKIETLGGGIGGTGAANKLTYFTAPTTIAALPVDWNGTKYNFYNTATTDAFRFEVTPSTTTTGIINLGAISANTNKIDIVQSSNRIRVSANSVLVGDAQGVANSTYLQVLDSSRSFIFVADSTASIVNFDQIRDFKFFRTLTPPATVGAQTINRPQGSVNFGAGASSLVVTNSVADANSLIFLTPQANDATCKSFAVTRAAGSFTIAANAACTAETTVAFQVTN